MEEVDRDLLLPQRTNGGVTSWSGSIIAALPQTAAKCAGGGSYSDRLQLRDNALEATLDQC